MGDPRVVPPHNSRYEQLLLGALMLPDARPGGARDNAWALDLTEELFYQESHRVMFRAIQAVLAAGLTVDVVAVAERLRATGQYDAAGDGDRRGVRAVEGSLERAWSDSLRAVRDCREGWRVTVTITPIANRLSRSYSLARDGWRATGVARTPWGDAGGFGPRRRSRCQHGRAVRARRAAYPGTYGATDRAADGAAQDGRR
jgi:hypothetical protein